MSRKDDRFERVVRRLDSRGKLLGSQELAGGISARVTMLEIEDAIGQTRKIVVRRHGKADLQQNLHAARDEYRLLRLLQPTDIAVPVPCFYDASCKIFDSPYVVMEYIDGEPEFAPDDTEAYLSRLAVQLAAVHEVRPSRIADLSVLVPRSELMACRLVEHPARVDTSSQEDRIRATLERSWPSIQRNESVLLHGDFWPGNVLWKDELPVGIVDWEDAAIGDPLADLANARLEILWAFGPGAMNVFTKQYASVTSVDLRCLPYWDLVAAMRLIGFPAWTAGDGDERLRREGHEWFVDQALDESARFF